MAEPGLIVVSGLPGVGKSAIADAVGNVGRAVAYATSSSAPTRGEE